MDNLKPDVSSFTLEPSEIVFHCIKLEAKDEFQPSCSVEQEECNSLSDPLLLDVFDSPVKFECKQEVKEELIIEENWVPSEAADVAATPRSIEVVQRENTCIPNDCSKSNYASVSLLEKTCAQIAEESKLHILPSNTHSNITTVPENICRFSGERTLSCILSPAQFQPSCSVEQEECNSLSDPLRDVLDSQVKFMCKQEVKEEITIEENWVPSEAADVEATARSIEVVQRGNTCIPNNCSRYSYASVSLTQKTCATKQSIGQIAEESKLHILPSNKPSSVTNVPANIYRFTGEMTLPCTLSSGKANKIARLRNNSRVEKIFSCSVCSAKFGSNSNLKSHTRIHTGERPFPCTVCSAEFICRSDLNKHTRIHTGERPFSCSVCSAKFSSRSHLNTHTRSIHTGERPFSCTVCSAKFICRYNLNKHTRIHTNERPFSCTVCSAKFICRSDLTKHTRIHTGERPFLCTVCSAKFSSQSQLKSHTRVHTGERPFSCTVCSAKFICRYNLNKHSCIHTNERPFSCTVCSAKFICRSDLTRHTRIHTGERPFSCSVCSAKFGSSSDLKVHTRIHTGERPFPCTVCSAKFICRSHLNTHTRIHTGERPFSCIVCSDKFICRSDLTRHTYIHTGERPFPCTVCSAKFSCSSRLKSHSRIHIGDRLFSCEHCSSTFRHKVSLKMHMRIHMVETSLDQ